MERRLEAGESLDVHSVASFFVSRVDTEVDRRLADLGREDLRGIAAVANARAAYARFEELFEGERFAALRDAGCPVQRPLWASTGVKDPHYPETKYVATLVAPHTVNTMPMPTLLACGERLELSGADARAGPDGGPERARRRRHRHGATSPTSCCARASRSSSSRSTTLLAGVEHAREGVVTGRPQHDQLVDPRAARARR